VYGVHNLQVPLPGRWVIEGTLVLNYCATSVVPAQKDRPPPLVEDVATFRNTYDVNVLGTSKNLIMSPDRARSQE
jgi:hypothetical protein